jgi:type II secretory pathway pseudopilin PulG
MKKQRGQTLIEAVVALSVMLLIIAAIAVTVVNGLYNSQFIKNQNLANKYAQQAMEQVRFMQENDLAGFATLSGSYCVGEDNIFVTGDKNTCPPNMGTPPTHKRIVDIEEDVSVCQSDEFKITVTDSWSSSKCASDNAFCHKSELVSCLSKTLPNNNP